MNHYEREVANAPKWDDIVIRGEPDNRPHRFNPMLPLGQVCVFCRKVKADCKGDKCTR